MKSIAAGPLSMCLKAKGEEQQTAALQAALQKLQVNDARARTTPRPATRVASQAAWYRMENGPKSKNGKKLAKKKKMALSPK